MCSEAAKRAPGGKHLRGSSAPWSCKIFDQVFGFLFSLHPVTGCKWKPKWNKGEGRGYAREVTSFARNHSVRLNEQSVAGPGRCTCCWYNSLEASDCAFKWVWPEERLNPHHTPRQFPPVRVTGFFSLKFPWINVEFLNRKTFYTIICSSFCDSSLTSLTSLRGKQAEKYVLIEMPSIWTDLSKQSPRDQRQSTKKFITNPLAKINSTNF